jgi:hypothetical protein
MGRVTKPEDSKELPLMEVRALEKPPNMISSLCLVTL